MYFTLVNNRLTAASPQEWFNHNQYSSDELEAFEYALSNIQFINHVPYNTFVADVYITDGNSRTEKTENETPTCHLIELNPGASLFNWDKDYDILYGLNDGVELRYLSVINY